MLPVKTVAVLLLLASVPVQADPCVQAQARYQAGLQAADARERWRAFSESAQLCPNLPSLYRLGLALIELQRWEEALVALERAKPYSACRGGPDGCKTKHAGWIEARMAEAYLGQSRFGHAYVAIERGFAFLGEIGETPPRWMFELRGRIDDLSAHELNAGTIGEALQGMRFMAEPSINLQVNFAFAEARLTDLGRQQAAALAGALRPYLEKYDVLLVGHTDDVGPAEYNQRLSEARANAVRGFLVAAGAVEARRLRALGLGETAPRHLNDSDDNRARNRRVEVRLVRR